MIWPWASEGIGTMAFNPRFTIANAITAALTKIAYHLCDLWV
jgi:hypothetical protein